MPSAKLLSEVVLSCDSEKVMAKGRKNVFELLLMVKIKSVSIKYLI